MAAVCPRGGAGGGGRGGGGRFHACCTAAATEASSVTSSSSACTPGCAASSASASADLRTVPNTRHPCSRGPNVHVGRLRPLPGINAKQGPLTPPRRTYKDAEGVHPSAGLLSLGDNGAWLRNAGTSTCAARSAAVARPIPLEAPVTTTDRTAASVPAPRCCLPTKATWLSVAASVTAARRAFSRRLGRGLQLTRLAQRAGELLSRGVVVNALSPGLRRHCGWQRPLESCLL